MSKIPFVFDFSGADSGMNDRPGLDEAFVCVVNPVVNETALGDEIGRSMRGAAAMALRPGGPRRSHSRFYQARLIAFSESQVPYQIRILNT